MGFSAESLSYRLYRLRLIKKMVQLEILGKDIQQFIKSEIR